MYTINPKVTKIDRKRGVNKPTIETKWNHKKCLIQDVRKRGKTEITNRKNT